MLLKDNILQIIYENERWMTSGEIKTLITDKSKSTIKTALSDLNKAGFLDAQPYNNSRQYEYNITDKGVWRVTGKRNKQKPSILQMPTPEQIYAQLRHD